MFPILVLYLGPGVGPYEYSPFLTPLVRGRSPLSVSSLQLSDLGPRSETLSRTDTVSSRFVVTFRESQRH